MADTFTVDPVAPERFSMSFMRAAEGCLRRAHMEREADTAGPDALVGRIFHEVAGTIGLRCSMSGEVQVSPDEAHAIAERVMENPEDADPLTAEVYDTVLGLVERWAKRAHFRPGEQFEIGSRVELDGRTHSARIDRVHIDGSLADVRDYKTGWADPAKELTFQGNSYCWHVLRRFPEVQTVRYTEDHVRFGIENGPYEVTRDDLPRIERTLRTLARRIERQYESGVLTASPGSACSSPGRCPVAGTCPVPEWARPATAVESEDEARAQFEALLAEEALIADRKAMIRGWLEANERRALQHEGQEIGYAREGGTRFEKKQALADLAFSRGGPIEPSDYETKTKPGFGRRKAK